MNTNAAILSKQLKAYAPRMYGPDGFFSFCTFRLFSEDALPDIQQRSIYILSYSVLAQYRSLPDAACYVCIGDDPRAPEELEAHPPVLPTILLDTAAGPNEVFYTLISNFFVNMERLNSIKSVLLDLLSQRAELGTILQAATKRLLNPFAVFDPNFALISHSIPKDLNLEDAQRVVKNKSANLYVLQELRKNGALGEIQSAHKILLTDLPNGYKKLSCALTIGSTSFGLLCFYNYIRPFVDEDYEIVDYISKIACAYFQRNISLSTHWNPYDYFFNQLLADTLNQQQLSTICSEFNLTFPQQMRVLVVSSNSYERVLKNIPFTVIQTFLRSALPTGQAFTYESYVVCLAKAEKLSPDSNEKFFSALNEFLGNNVLFCGISNIFTDITELKDFIGQAVVALDMGIGSESPDAIYFYKDYTIPHMLKVISKSKDIFKFCHPAFFLLTDYDRQYKTHYLDCLIIYLQCNGNMNECAKYFMVHYNSIKYRLKVIQSICNIDLHDTNTFVHLYLSSKIWESRQNSIFLTGIEDDKF